jgi:hypothetical protein
MERDVDYYMKRAAYCFRLARSCERDPLAATFRELGREFAELAVGLGGDPAELAAAEAAGGR